MPTLTETYIDLMMRSEQILGHGSIVEIRVSEEHFHRLCWERASDRREYEDSGFYRTEELRLTNGTSLLIFKPRSSNEQGD